MRLLVDENLPGIIAELARQRDIPAAWVRDEMRSAPDTEILGRLGSSGEILVTCDIRFANHVLEQIVAGSPLGGVILIREQKMRNLIDAWERFLENPRVPRGIAVVTTRSVRYREAPSQKETD